MTTGWVRQEQGVGYIENPIHSHRSWWARSSPKCCAWQPGLPICGMFRQPGLNLTGVCLAIIDQACRELGRDPSTLGRSWGGGCACAPSQAEAEALAGDRFSGKDPEDFGFVSTPTQVVDQMRRFIDLGVDTFMLDCVDFPKMDMLELLIDKVLPAVNS